jgi:hypothetical protein
LTAYTPHTHIKLPRSNKPAGKLPVPGKYGHFVEAVYLPEIFWIFSDDFWPVPTGKHWKLTGIHRKKSGQFLAEILLPCSSDFRCFPAGSRGIRWPESSTWVVILFHWLVDIISYRGETKKEKKMVNNFLSYISVVVERGCP